MQTLRSLRAAWLAAALILTPLTLAAQSAPAKEKMGDKMGAMSDKKMDDKMGKMDDKMGMMGESMMVGGAGFKGAGDHPATGSYALAAAKGKMTLTTSADFSHDPKAPDVYIVLAKGNKVSANNGLWVGKVKSASGAQSFEIPANAKMEGYDTVVLWCKKYNALMGTAPLQINGSK